MQYKDISVFCSVFAYDRFFLGKAENIQSFWHSQLGSTAPCPSLLSQNFIEILR